MNGMDLTEMMDVMALDLKMTLDSEISKAEATRCIGRAVDDLSRHLPRERIYEHTWVKAVTDDTITMPSAADSDYIVAAEDISASVDGDTCTIAAMWPDVPRPITITLTDANDSITSLTLIIKGIDATGVNREERFYRYNGKSQTGTVYFKEVNEVEINEISGNGAGDVLNVGVATPDTAGVEAWVSLSAPVEYDTETVYSGAGKTGTKYTRDTDYEMDYSNGRIRLKNGGSMAAGTAYYVNYDRNAVRVDIGSILNDLTRIVKVMYPVGNIPEQEVAWGIWDDMLIIGSQLTGESQKSLSDKEHLMVMYESKHTPPTINASGSYPGYLDQVVLIGAEGYALLIEALEHELLASTGLASMRTELGLTTAIHTKVAAALDKIATYCETNGTTDNAKEILADITDNVAELRTKINTAYDAVATALGSVDLTSVATYLGSADTALTAAGAALTSLKKYLDNNTNADAIGLLAQITTDAASLRTALNTALDAANAELDAGDFSDVATHLTAAGSALDKINTYLANNTNEDAKSWLTKVTTDIASLRTAIVTAQDAANTLLDTSDFSDVATHLTSAAAALAKVTTYLESNTNEDSKYWLTKITTDIAGLRTAVNTAADACNAYTDEVDTTDLGQASVGAEAYLETGDDKINVLNDGGPDVPSIYADYSRARTQIGQTRTQAALAYAQEANVRLTNLRTYLEQAGAWGKIAAGFVSEAQEEILMAQQISQRESVKATQAGTYLQEALSRMNNLKTYIEQAAGWGAIAQGFAEEAVQRIAMAGQISNRENVVTGHAAGYIQEAQARAENLRTYIEQSNAYVVVANAFRDEAVQRLSAAMTCVYQADRIINREAVVIQKANAYVAEAAGRADNIRTFIEESAGWVLIANAFRDEATLRVEELKTHLDEASKYRESVEAEMLLSDRFRTEGTNRLTEFRDLLRNRAEYRKRTVDIPVRQPM